MKLGVAIYCACFSVAILASGCAQEGIPLPVSEWSKRPIVAAAHGWIKGNLAAPATASFDPEGPASVRATYFPTGDFTKFVVIGDVDAENGFGALVRKHYLVTFKEPGRHDEEHYLQSTASIESAEWSIN